MDEYQNEFSSRGLTLLIGFAAVAVRLIMSVRHLDYMMVFRAICATAFVALLVGELLMNVDIHPSIKNAIIGVCCFIGRELLEGLIQLAEQFKKDPKAFIESIRKGGK
ncbi:hypothetical protein [Endozoicomonas sp. ALE010]|uniref:hypothetical protein n=1 Tax=Endozoicomonas sp. ALE010 TaxID=3403081 RepID=UPI003BB5FDF4